MDASSVPAVRAETVKTMGSSQGKAVDHTSSAPAARAGNDPGAAAACGTDQGNGDDPLAILSGGEAHELSSCSVAGETATPDSNGPDPGSEPTPVG